MNKFLLSQGSYTNESSSKASYYYGKLGQKFTRNFFPDGQFHGSWIDHHETMAYVAHYILAEEIPPEPIDPWPLGRIAEIMYGDRRRREVLNESISGYFLVHPESKGLKPMKEKNWCDELKPLKPSQNPVIIKICNYIFFALKW